MKKKLIGVTGPSSFTEHVYSAVEKALDACFIPLYHNDYSNLEYLTENLLDAVIFAGGVDIHPMSYIGRNQVIGVVKSEGLSSFSLQRDKRENFIYKKCLELKIPFMGICRGHQLILMNEDKFDFILDLSTYKIAHSPKKAGITLEQDEPCHIITLINDSFLGDKKDIRWVNSFHHQGFKIKNSFEKFADEDLAVLAVAGGEPNGLGVIEAAESINNKWISVQWHPEYDWETNSVSRDCFERFKFLVNG